MHAILDIPNTFPGCPEAALEVTAAALAVLGLGLSTLAALNVTRRPD